MKNNPLQKPLILKNPIQNYAWGEKGDSAFIAKFLGVKAKKDTPYAELWVGAHPKGVSLVEVSGKFMGLDKLIKKYPQEIFGKKIKQFPFLLKILSAGEALSVQAHPNKKQATVLHKKDPKNYPDANEKNELAIALTPFTALISFKPKKEIVKTLKKHFELLDFVKEKNNADVKKIYSKIINKAIKKPVEFETLIENLFKKINLLVKNKKAEEYEKLFIQLKKKYRHDVGLISLFLLNVVHLKPGEGLHMETNTLHAYVKGSIVEFTDNSDNTVRAGLTPKFKDIKTLVKILNYSCGKPKILKNKYKPLINNFEIKKIKLLKNKILNFKNKSFKIILITKGELCFEWGSEKKKIKKGQVVLVPFILENSKVKAFQDAEFFTCE